MPINITGILKQLNEQENFIIQVNEDRREANWSITIKNPNPHKAKKWLEWMSSKIIPLAGQLNSIKEDDIDENEAKNWVLSFLAANLSDLTRIAGEILDCVESWEDIKAESKKDIKAYMSLNPMKAATFAFNFIQDYKEWHESLKKSSSEESNGN